MCQRDACPTQVNNELKEEKGGEEKKGGEGRSRAKFHSAFGAWWGGPTLGERVVQMPEGCEVALSWGHHCPGVTADHAGKCEGGSQPPLGRMEAVGPRGRTPTAAGDLARWSAVLLRLCSLVFFPGPDPPSFLGPAVAQLLGGLVFPQVLLE